ncbi:MAG: ATP-binding protein [Bacteroidales bacterium]|nr:ATP-binding protein [Bacteroidales bacterium]
MKKILFIVALSSIFQITSAQDNLFRQYGPEYGLNNSFLYSLNQDNSGYLWIGTGEGLYRFNGFECDIFTDQDSLAENFVTTIFKDLSGRLWVGHMSGGITRIDNHHFDILVESSAFNSSITDITESDSSTIWCATQNEGIILFDNSDNFKKISVDLNNELIFSIKHLSANNFLLGTDENLYISEYVAETGTFIIKNSLKDLPVSKVSRIIKESSNSFLILTQDEGIFNLKVEEDNVEFKLDTIDNNESGRLDNLQGGLLADNNTLWINTMGNGIIKYLRDDSNLFSFSGTINSDNGLPSNNVKYLFKDREENIWFGMFGEGLIRYIDDNLKFFSYEDITETNDIYSIAPSGKNIWIGTENSLIKLNNNDGSVLESFELPLQNKGKIINSIYESENGLVYMGYDKTGITVFNPVNKSFYNVRLDGDDLKNSINSITGDSDFLWISTKKGACKYSLQTGQKIWFDTRNGGLPHNNIQTLFIDSNGRVLVGTYCKNIFYIDIDNTVKPDPKLKLNGLNSVISFAEDSEKSIWVATSGSGVYKFNEKVEIGWTFIRSSGLLSDYCYSMVYNNLDKIVVGHRGGFSEIETREKPRIKTYTNYEGIKTSTEFYLNSATVDTYNRIWFGTSEGVIKFLPELTTKGLTPPLIHIDAIYIDEEPYETQNQLMLDPGFYEIRVDYTAINFSNPELVKYSSILEGYNKWSNHTSDRTVTFNRVGHGNYHFKIGAFNENGISSNISGFELKIKKPIYLSLWFYLIVIIVISAFVYAIIRARERNLRLAQERLIKNLDEKTKEVIVKEEIIKERKKAEKELIEAKERAELSDKLKTSFLTNMSHEIRTPMNAIVGFTELLKDSDMEDKERNSYMTNIITNSRGLLSLIDDLLDISKIESNQLNLKLKECNISDLFKDIYSHYRETLNEIEKQNIELELDQSGNDKPILIETDCTRLRQVLSKMLDNAVKFTDSGTIKFGYTLESEQITFYVEDTGIGMTPDKIEIIFDLFRKVEENKLRLYRGTGLGLSLSQHLVRLLGGEITVESEEGKGSKFMFSLSLEGLQESETSQAKANNNIGLGFNFTDKNILVVEDDTSNYLLIKEVIKPTGAILHHAVDGEKALKIFKEVKNLDLIIMDIKLPGVDGYEVTRSIRQMNKDLPILAHTAYAMEGDRERSIEAGCNAYLAKPTNHKLLLKTIENLILKARDGRITF